jgi:hypothetical protein
LWQLAQVAAGLTAPLCASWQLAQVWCPFGAVDAWGAWHVAHAAGARWGACAALRWHDAQVACPLVTAVACGA